MMRWYVIPAAAVVVLAAGGVGVGGVGGAWAQTAEPTPVSPGAEPPADPPAPPAAPEPTTTPDPAPAAPTPPPAPASPAPAPAPAPAAPATAPAADPVTAPSVGPPVAPPPGAAADADRSAEPTEIMVYLKDGQAVTGMLVEASKTKLVVRLGGIETTFPASMVDRYKLLPPVMQRYEEMRRAVGEDAEQIVKLAEWLRARERYDLALVEIDRALEIDSANPEAQQLRVLLEKQIELKRKSRGAAAPAVGPSPAQPVPAARPAPTARPGEFPLLSDDQINIIKVYEIDLARPPRLVIKRTTVDRLLERYRGHPLIPVTQEGREAIYRKTEKEILELMFRLQARELYNEVKVIDPPESMRLFRDDVHQGWLVNSCATTACHGGEEAGRLQLFNRKPRADAAVYTNFLILDRYRLSDGTPLINYDAPERSALLQMTLPREDSIFPHPPVPMAGPGGGAGGGGMGTSRSSERPTTGGSSRRSSGSRRCTSRTRRTR